MTVRRRAWAAALAALALALTIAPIAGSAAASPTDAPRGDAARAALTSAGTIVFVRGHDIWLASGDGRRIHRVTTDGTAARPYRSPTMSDGGLIAAGHGHHLVTLRQNGTVVTRMDPPALTGSTGHPLDGPPVDVAISPDGRLIAYTFTSYQCPVGVPCGARAATAITRSDRLIPAATYGQTYYWAPSWVSNTRTLQSGGYLHQVSVKDLGAPPVHWFDDHEVREVPAGASTDLEQADLSPDGRWLAAVRGYGDDTRVTWYAVNGDVRTGAPPVVPTWLCATDPAIAGMSSPTWAPDSTAFAWQEPDGVWATRPPTGGECHAPVRLIANASQPDWSRAPLAPGPRPFASAPAPKVAGKARVGRKLTARVAGWSPAPSTVTYQWLRNGRKIRGATKARYQLARADRGKRITVRVTGTRGGYKPVTTTSRPTQKVR